jgi:hypothetical protein
MRADDRAGSMPNRAGWIYIILICCRIYSYDATAMTGLGRPKPLMTADITNLITNFVTGNANQLIDMALRIRNGEAENS